MTAYTVLIAEVQPLPGGCTWFGVHGLKGTAGETLPHTCSLAAVLSHPKDTLKTLECLTVENTQNSNGKLEYI